MKPHQIESWVLKIVEQVISGHPIEDSRVELKSIWIEPEKAARQIAGHANSARGAPILWIIGVDEKQRQLVGADYEELSEWFEQVKSHFDGLYPDLYHRNVPINDKTVAALLFDTQRAPYVVKNPAFGTKHCGPVSLEVPFREGTLTRSARRNDLILILSPLQTLPAFEVLEGTLMAEYIRENGEPKLKWKMDMELYVDSNTTERIVIPNHRCKVECNILGLDRVELGGIKLAPRHVEIPFGEDRGRRILSKTIEGTPDEVVLYGSGIVELKSSVSTPLIGETIDEKIPFKISLYPSNSDIAAVIDGFLYLGFNSHGPHLYGYWVYESSSKEA